MEYNLQRGEGKLLNWTKKGGPSELFEIKEFGVKFRYMTNMVWNSHSRYGPGSLFPL